MRSRLPLPDPDRLSAEQREVHASILATRGNIDGPFLAWMHSPRLAGLAEKLGAFCRYDTSLSLEESELLILCVAARHRCVGEQQIHEPIAIRAGLSEQSVQALRERRVPPLTGRLQLLHAFAAQLLAEDRVEADLYERARAEYGDATLVEIVGILGYYAMVALTLNAFEMTK